MTRLLLLVSLTFISIFYSCKKSNTETDPFKDLDPNTTYCWQCKDTNLGNSAPLPDGYKDIGCYTYAFFLTIQFVDSNGSPRPNYDRKVNCRLK